MAPRLVEQEALFRSYLLATRTDQGTRLMKWDSCRENTAPVKGGWALSPPTRVAPMQTRCSSIHALQKRWKRCRTGGHSG
jgi:hypothetical protein